MFPLLWLIPLLPFASALLLAVFGTMMPRRAVSVIGVGSIGASTVFAILAAAAFLAHPPPGNAYDQVLWTWMAVGNFRQSIGLYLDALSLFMALVVAFVSMLIHLYSTWYMAEDDGYSRFFAYMNLFVGSMLTLILADNLLFLFLGWEGVGLCSYLLIGFWYRDLKNARAAQKAFLVTRAGDTAFTVGLLVLFTSLGTLNVQDLMSRAAAQWTVGSALPIAAAALLLGGAVGKSAQLPLQTWLPDAMAGPTPTSALIHAATMVTAGVYLIARTHTLYSLAPQVMTAVAVIGALTLLISGCSALTQREVKRILAYSTISQIGYMFLALGVGAWAPAIFHFYTHAFFKALLFLAAGVVIESLHHENDIFRMGGLRRDLPLAFWAFLAGGSALAGLPYITAGFYSKDLIIWKAWGGSPLLWIAAIIGVVLTSLYTFRMIFVMFLGEPKAHVAKRPGLSMTIPVVVLSFFAIVAGFINLPPSLGNSRILEGFLGTALPAGTAEATGGLMTEGFSELASALAFLLGLVVAYWLYVRSPKTVEALTAGGFGAAVHRFWEVDWGFDWLYDHLFVRPVIWIARVNKGDFVDAIYAGIASVARFFNGGLALTETGRVRWYAAGVAGGAVILLAIAIFA